MNNKTEQLFSDFNNTSIQDEVPVVVFDGRDKTRIRSSNINFDPTRLSGTWHVHYAQGKGHAHAHYTDCVKLEIHLTNLKEKRPHMH